MVDGDVYRLEAEASGGWEVWMPHEIVGIENGESREVEVIVVRRPGDRARSEVTLEVTSESDSAVSETVTCAVNVSDTNRSG